MVQSFHNSMRLGYIFSLPNKELGKKKKAASESQTLSLSLSVVLPNNQRRVNTSGYYNRQKPSIEAEDVCL